MEGRRKKMKQDHRRKNTALIGIAGVHFVVGELSQRGMIALPTIRNTAGFDIIVASADGRKHANIQVKTSSKENPRYWLTPPSKKIRTGSHDHYIFVSLRNEKPHEFLLVKGKVVKEEVARRERNTRPAVQKGTRKEESHSFRVDQGNERKSEKWKEAWKRWKL